MHVMVLARGVAVAALLLLASVPLRAPIAAAARAEPAATVPEIERTDYFRPGIAPVHQGAGYDVTIVYFMDYQCPSCRRYTPDVARVLAEDRKLRVIYRDTPIISEMSTVASRAAIAASFQGKHAAFHHALMMTKGQLTEDGIRAAANRAKVDWARLLRDLKARGEAIDLQIGRNTELAVATGVMGTPAFIVGDRLSNGALDYASLKAEIADARAAAGNKRAVREIPAATDRSAAATTNGAAAATNDGAPAEPAMSPFREASPAVGPVVSASNGSELPWPLLAGGAVLLAIAAAWLVQRRRVNRD